MQRTNGRDGGVDIAKCIAIFAVMVIHTASVAVTAYDAESIDWFGVMTWGSLARFAVPVFFMCSGAVFLNRDITYRDIFLKYILRIVIALFFWSALYELFNFLQGLCTAPEAVKNVITLNNHFHFYYLEILLLVYLFLPILRSFVKHAEGRTIAYGIILWLIVGILIPTFGGVYPFTLWSGIIHRWYLPQAWSAMGYAVLGCFMTKVELKKIICGIIFLVGFAVTFCGCILTNFNGGEFVETFWGGMSLGPCFMAAGLFGFCRGYRNSGRFAGYISRGSFCVYLCHDFFNIILRKFGLSPAYGGMTLVSIPALSLLVFALSMGVYALLKHIPVVRKWLI